MKKAIILLIVCVITISAKAQWTDDASMNTILAVGETQSGEVIVSTDPNSDNTYVQWLVGEMNGWSPTLQCLDYYGNPQWGEAGIHPNYYQLGTWSQGMAMTATTDGAVVTCFATGEGMSAALKINADGTYAWGEDGAELLGDSRTEVLAGDDGGVWTLTSDINNTYVCYIEANGITNPTITISSGDQNHCSFGQMVATTDGVFVVYEKEHWAYTYYYEKEIWVAGFNKYGEAITTPTRLMNAVTMVGAYCHYVVPDGLGGGYAYIWHPSFGDSFNVYVFHFNANGESTIEDPYDIAVHWNDPNNFYLNADATVDPTNHDLIITYRQTDALSQSQAKIYVNRITPTGERVWGDGKLVLDNGTTFCSDLLIDIFEDGQGFSIIYNRGAANSTYYSIIDAKGFDIEGNELWTTNMSSQASPKSMSEKSTGYHNGQNIVAWADNHNGYVYGQNIGQNGELGKVTPTSVPENTQEEIVKVTEIFNINGQHTNTLNISELNQGIYIIKGVTEGGKTVIRKIVR